MAICFFNKFVQIARNNEQSLHIYSISIWILNTLLLIFFLLELQARKVKWCKLSHAHIVVILSMTSSIISSSFFLISDFHIFHSTFNYTHQYPQICLFAPIIAMSFRTIAKHFTWALYIVRGQMVMASLHNNFIIQFSKKVPYILTVQCITVTTCIIIFTDTDYDIFTNTCHATLPLWLLICSALIGETCYGLGFMYIFYKAMTKSLDHVYKTLQKSDVDEAKKQLRHHITIYFIQLTLSILFVLFVALCICLETLLFFEAELFISNFCLLLLFRNKGTVFTKAIKSCLQPQGSIILKHHLQPLDISQKHTKSSRNLRSLQTRHANQLVLKKNTFASHFLANKWISDTEVINVQKDIFDTPNTNGIEIFYYKEKSAADECKLEHSRMPTMEALEIISNTLELEQYISSEQTGHKRNNTARNSISMTEPSYKINLDQIETQSAPIRIDNNNTDFEINANINGSMSTGALIQEMFSNSQMKCKTDIIQKSIQANMKHKKIIRAQSLLKEKFEVAKQKLKTGLRSQSATERDDDDVRDIGRRSIGIDKQSLVNEDFASVEPAELRSSFSSKMNEYDMKQMFTLHMNDENEQNMVYLDDEFEVYIDDDNLKNDSMIMKEFEKLETIKENDMEIKMNGELCNDNGQQQL